MHVTRAENAIAYQAPGHHAVDARRLQGRDATPCETMWVGLSTFAPGGSAEWGAAPSEKIYVVVEGSIVVTTAAGEVALGPLDSCLIEAGEGRGVQNRGATAARLLVVSRS